MTVLVTAVLAALMCVAPGAYARDDRMFSPLRDDMMVAQATVSDSLPVVRRTSVPDEAAEPEPSAPATATVSAQTPSGTLYRSLALAGWGQWNNGRRDKALLFFAAEAICVGGYLYQNALYTSGDYTGSEKDAIRTNRNTCLLYWMIAKVFGVMDAYVDAQFSSYDIDDITPSELARPQDDILP